MTNTLPRLRNPKDGYEYIKLDKYPYFKWVNKKITMTNKAHILEILKEGDAFTCAEITKIIIEQKYITPQPYLSGSISSTLAKMVKDGILEYAIGIEGPKGGHIYQIKAEPEYSTKTP